MIKLILKQNLTLLICLLFLTPFQLFAQKVFDKMADQTCKCLEKNNVTTREGIAPCVEKAMFDNIKAVNEFYGIKSISELDGHDLGRRVGLRVGKNCPYLATVELKESGLDTLKNELIPNDTNEIVYDVPSCEKLQNGDYYYFQPPYLKDTIFVTFSDKLYLERISAGRYYSMLDLKWKSNCEFELKFVSSNDPDKSLLSKPGDKYSYKIIEESESSFLVEFYWHTKKYPIRFFKTKKL